MGRHILALSRSLVEAACVIGDNNVNNADKGLINLLAKGGGSGGASLAAMPEPAAITLILMGAVGVLCKGRRSWSRTAVLLIAVAVCMMSPDSTFAANKFWDGTGTGWNTASFWSTASNATTPDPATPPGSADIALFNISTVNTAQTVNLNAAQ